MFERPSDRWLSILLSVVLHGALVAALAYGWWMFRQARPPTPTLAIQATVVDPRTIAGAARAPPQPAPPLPTAPPQPPPEPPEEPTGPPEPTPEELAQRQAAKEAQEKQAAEQKEAQERRQAEERQAQEQAQAQRQALAAAEAKKRAQEQKLAQQKAAEERAKAQEQKRLEAQREAEEKERQAELQRSLAAEEQATAARSSGALASWQAQITARIQHAWLRPPSARQGIECVLYVTQVPGGEVVNVRIGACNGDQAVRESIAAAAYRASPLPPPPDPALFERNLEITFRPD